MRIRYKIRKRGANGYMFRSERQSMSKLCHPSAPTETIFPKALTPSICYVLSLWGRIICSPSTQEISGDEPALHFLFDREPKDYAKGFLLGSGRQKCDVLLVGCGSGTGLQMLAFTFNKRSSGSASSRVYSSTFDLFTYAPEFSGKSLELPKIIGPWKKRVVFWE